MADNLQQFLNTDEKNKEWTLGGPQEQRTALFIFDV